MSSRRSISWSQALNDLRADRIAVPAGLRTAHSHVGLYVRFRGPLVVAGRIDRAAVMAAACRAAREHQTRTGSTWAAAMSLGLTAAWGTAKAARAATAQ